MYFSVWPIRIMVDYVCSLLSRRGKTGGSGRVRVGSIGSAGQTGHGSKRVIFKRVNRVTGQSDFGSGRVDPYFSNFFFFFFFFQLQKD